MSGEAALRMSKSRQKWQAVVESLWQPDGPRLTELLGDIVAAIKAEKDPIAAENMLICLLSSPKSRELRVQASSKLIPRNSKAVWKRSLMPPTSASGRLVLKLRQQQSWPSATSAHRPSIWFPRSRAWPRK